MVYLLDTDICIHWLRGNLRVHGQLAAIGPQAIAVSTITLAELHYGASSSARADENHAAIDDFVSALTVIDNIAHFERISDLRLENWIRS